ncbi:TPA: PTS transporter subunit EIIC [Escherichia coli]|nr:PTS sugar transporter subunit IIC [Escherichia coli]
MGLMASFERGMERFLVPVAIKLNSQKHVAAVRDGFVFTFPIIMASSLIILINFAILSPDGFIAGLLHLNSIFPNLEKAQAIFTPVMNGSVNIMSIMIAFLVARNVAISYEQDDLLCGLTAIGAFFIVYTPYQMIDGQAFLTTKYLGAQALGLLLAIFIASKRAEYRDLAKMSFIPGIFNINEPIMFGLPIVLNPIMMVPFIMVPIVNCAIGYFFVSMEIIPPVAYAVPWTTPGPLIAFLGTGGNWLALLVGFLCLGVATMIYLPFVIAANKVNNMTTNG